MLAGSTGNIDGCAKMCFLSAQYVKLCTSVSPKLQATGATHRKVWPRKSGETLGQPHRPVLREPLRKCQGPFLLFQATIQAFAFPDFKSLRSFQLRMSSLKCTLVALKTQPGDGWARRPTHMQDIPTLNTLLPVPFLLAFACQQLLKHMIASFYWGRWLQLRHGGAW